MSKDTETITIPSCPICAASHTYSLKIERSLVLGMVSVNDIHEKPRAVRITRLFTCPSKAQDFQATFVLYDTANSRIKSVDVSELAEDTQ